MVYSSILEGEGKSELETSSPSSLTVEGAFGLLSVAGVDKLRVERLEAVSQFVSMIAQEVNVQRRRRRVGAGSDVRIMRTRQILTRCSRSSEAAAETVNLPGATSGSAGRCHLEYSSIENSRGDYSRRFTATETICCAHRRRCLWGYAPLIVEAGGREWRTRVRAMANHNR